MTRGGLDPNAWCPAVLLCRRCRVIAVHRRIARAGCIKWPLGRHRCIRAMMVRERGPILGGREPLLTGGIRNRPHRLAYIRAASGDTGSSRLSMDAQNNSFMDIATYYRGNHRFPYPGRRSPCRKPAGVQGGQRFPANHLPGTRRYGPFHDADADRCARSAGKTRAAGADAERRAGVRGVYILPLGNISGLRKPTVHDRRLAETIAMLPGVTPEVIRHTACEIAAEGLAGRGALTAARGALKGEQEARLLANFDLLLEVVRQIEPKGRKSHPTGGGSSGRSRTTCQACAGTHRTKASLYARGSGASRTAGSGLRMRRRRAQQRPHPYSDCQYRSYEERSSGICPANGRRQRGRRRPDRRFNRPHDPDGQRNARRYPDAAARHCDVAQPLGA